MGKMFKGILLFFVLGVGVFLVSNITQAAVSDWDRIGDGTDSLDMYNSIESTIFNDQLYLGGDALFGWTDNNVGIERSKIVRSSNLIDWERAGESGYGTERINSEIVSMDVFNDYLYAAVHTSHDNYEEIWRSRNGTTWERVVDRDDFGAIEGEGFTIGSVEIRSLIVFNSRLYAITNYNYNDARDYGIRIWRSSNGDDWEQVNELGFGENFEKYLYDDPVVFDGKLYVGVGKSSANRTARIWSTEDGTTWNNVREDGFLLPSYDYAEIEGLVVFQGKLYTFIQASEDARASSGNPYFIDVWRTSNGITWERVSEDGGIGDLGDYSASSFGQNTIAIHNNKLYIGMRGCGLEVEGTNTCGNKILSSSNGVDWEQAANEDSFSDGGINPDNYGLENIVVFNDQLHAITANAIWRLSDSSDYEEVVDREKSATTTVDEALTDRLSGRILIQTEEEGEAWYVNPTDKKKYYLGRPADAFRIMREAGLGITNANLAKIPIDGTSWTINRSIAKYVVGRILIQTERNGEAWYVSPVNEKRYYMGRPTDAFQLMRNLGLGISNTDLRKIEVGE